MLGHVNALLLDNQVCFAVHAAARAMDGVYRRELAELGLTYPQYLVMLVLWERDQVTVKELGAALRLDSGTLSPLLKRLEAAGFVRRERSASDERSVLVRLTEQGTELRQAATRVPGRILEATGLELSEVLELSGTLTRMTRSLTQAVS
ncbi:DNA-binding transcriptional regulator, MarR family [Nonomuraea jiangxiensis]|uniref:DNA-binding transcriptional regulator, MarR family n=2 Tax=Nonomuraea jiangxiensis TaxID=633440 RepID=A0A1G7ZWV1_9ACTN|nr:DNA-binding transcriptional regulator, MarR family [Nonomuraea jiangxiensis]